MDHFTLESDDLYHAWRSGNLHRNFMGYTAQHTNLMIGLGVSAISDLVNSFAQNNKSIREYYENLRNNRLPMEKGYFLNIEDESFRKYILDISCRGETYFDEKDLDLLERFCFPELAKMQADGLVTLDDEYVKATALGKNFLRNICRCFDLHLLKQTDVSEKNIFRKAI